MCYTSNCQQGFHNENGLANKAINKAKEGGRKNLVNVEMLKTAIKDSGLKTGHICDKLGLSYYGFQNKLNGKNEFTVAEVNTLAKELRLSASAKMGIFFPKGFTESKQD